MLWQAWGPWAGDRAPGTGEPQASSGHGPPWILGSGRAAASKSHRRLSCEKEGNKEQRGPGAAGVKLGRPEEQRTGEQQGPLHGNRCRMRSAPGGSGDRSHGNEGLAAVNPFVTVTQAPDGSNCSFPRLLPPTVPGGR